MKRMSEVFDLPCGGVDIQGSDVYYSETEHEQNIDNMIAHAINHVDALADALEALLNFRSTSEYIDTEEAAIAALKAYRGEK